ncbi:hypothetical protein AAH991_21915 [Microbispora sp. ZYX-F-249]|uniref:Uncharacterized protein n=1 Tax=Microbispora maris TaxID=3144104 RepID=A0ABV0ASZ0_9ACTN
MTRTPLRAALVVAALAAGLSACQAPSPGPRTSPAPPTASPATTGAIYVTGAKAGDDPCARVVSAIGYLGLSLLPPGREEAQHWDGDVRGRFGYLRGTLEMYGPRLPAAAADAVAAVDGVAETLSRAGTAASRRPGLLRRYRAASAAVLAACGRS